MLRQRSDASGGFSFWILPALMHTIREASMSDSDNEARLCSICSVSLVDIFEGAVNPCIHYIGTGDDSLEVDYWINASFREAVGELWSWADSPAEVDFENVLAKAPEDLGELFRTARQVGFYYWADRESVIEVSNDFSRPCIDWYCQDYFHPGAESFMRSVADEASRALTWLASYEAGLLNDTGKQ